jgi:peptide/nickel transport system substrate-binding protein
VPAGTPARDLGRPLPGTGPYTIAGYRPNHVLRLVRNPYFHEWSQAAQPDGYPDEIVLRIGGTTDRAIADVIGGKADVLWLSRPISPAQLAAITTQHASQVHTNPVPGISALFLNVRVPPFNRLDVRRALNYAADRAAGVQALGGPNAARPTCQILPPNFPGFRPYCPYTAGSTTGGTWTAPDLAKARALVAHSGTRGMKVTVWTWTQARTFGTLAVRLLRSLGYRTTEKVVGDRYFALAPDPRNRAQIGWWGWSPDWPAPSGIFPPNFSCAATAPGNPQSATNAAGFCDPAVDREMRRAAREQATDPAAARRLWQTIDRGLVDRAPWVPLVNTTNVDVISRRAGNYQYSPAGPGMVLDQLWVRP